MESNGLITLLGYQNNIYAIKFTSNVLKYPMVLDLSSFDKKSLMLKLSTSKTYQSSIEFTTDLKMVKKFIVNGKKYDNRRL